MGRHGAVGWSSLVAFALPRSGHVGGWRKAEAEHKIGRKMSADSVYPFNYTACCLFFSSVTRTSESLKPEGQQPW